jgi:hypothetical protein
MSASSGQAVDLAAQPQAHVGGHLVVAAAAGVQPLAGVAHQRVRRASMFRCTSSSSSFHSKRPASISLGDLRHAALDVGQVLRRDDALRGQHLGMRQAAVDVGRHRRWSKSTLAV